MEKAGLVKLLNDVYYGVIDRELCAEIIFITHRQELLAKDATIVKLVNTINKGKIYVRRKN